MRFLFTGLIVACSMLHIAAQIPTESLEVTVHFYENAPFSYRGASGDLEGIEIDIFKAFEKWAEERKGVRIQSNYVSYAVFGNAYRRVSGEVGANHIGMATVSITPERLKDVDFSSPYMHNKSLMVSGGNAPTLHSVDEIAQKFNHLTALTIQASIHEVALKRIQNQYFPELKLDYRYAAMDIIDIIARNDGYFAFVDIVSFWNYVRSRADGYIKIQRAVATENESFGFIFPKGDSRLKELFNEFMDGGFGFVASKAYEKILIKYLDQDVLKYVDASQLD